MTYKSLIETFFALHAQIPDAKSENVSIDVVVVDEESVGSLDTPGCGAKILHKDGVLDPLLYQTKSTDHVVCFLISRLGGTSQPILVKLTFLFDILYHFISISRSWLN